MYPLPTGPRPRACKNVPMPQTNMPMAKRSATSATGAFAARHTSNGYTRLMAIKATCWTPLDIVTRSGGESSNPKMRFGGFLRGEGVCAGAQKRSARFPAKALAHTRYARAATEVSLTAGAIHGRLVGDSMKGSYLIGYEGHSSRPRI